MSTRQVIKNIVRTEKSYLKEPEGKYLFLVDKKANKTEIRKAVESRFKVNVTKVNTAIVKGKPRRVRYAPGKTAAWKKALVTLKSGQSIELGG